MTRAIEQQSRVVHGYRRAYRIGGEGSAIMFIHGIGDSSRTWDEVLPLFAENHLVIAPDLLGHGDSDKPRADYSIGGFANGMRDLLAVLDVERVTLVGHSLGGGIAMQLAYQYPQLVERIVLVSNGGSGRSVSTWLRLATLPLAPELLKLLRLPISRPAVSTALALLRRVDHDLGVDAPDLTRIVDALPDGPSRQAFARTLRAVVDWHGQVVTMLDRSYLASDVPMLMIWGDRDGVIPYRHAAQAQAALPLAALEVFHGAGHFPFRSDPERFTKVVEQFIHDTEPATWDQQAWQKRLRTGPGPEPDAPATQVVSE
ncbi:alpha/beta fold hydrolase [Nocardioides sp. WG-D5]|uniref:alpha/beta fold hydrolase n=1 Tax=Nocardioides luteus TaxID=1844 RepID=UPI0002028256|nr:alpha/beta hydrolase [Nocardioides luteus]EGD41289.1 hydrolase, alpha/beta hydrolase fold family [Nocardioidaceae bacterium Broad-1]MBG6095218.1 pimeloyl-ACP methyl ester carboxylesterase [Nocardioides luteus]